MKSLLITLLGFLSATLFACDILDDAGHTIHLTHPAARIISLSPDLTELLFSAGAGGHIVGVVKGSDYPLAATRLPIVATYLRADIEKVLGLKPDLIVAWTQGGLAKPLEKLGIPIFYSHPKKLIDIPHTLRRLGCLAGTPSEANQAASSFMQRYERIQQAYDHKKKITVFYQIWAHPLMTITRYSWIDDAIQLCGGSNVFSTLTGSAIVINREAVIQRDPDVMIGSLSNEDWRTSWLPWSHLQAVRHNRLFTLKSSSLSRASLSVLDGVEELCHLLHHET